MTKSEKLKEIKGEILSRLEEEGNVVNAPKKIFEANSILNWYLEDGKDRLTESQIREVVGRVLDGEFRLEWTKREGNRVPVLDKVAGR